MLFTTAIPEKSLDLLKRISPVFAARGFYLAGGTALALRLGHRLSVDLDFFSPEGFVPDEMALLLEAEAGGSCRILQKTGGSLCMMTGETKVEMFHYPVQMLEEEQELEGVLLASLPDNAAMKLSALSNRGEKKDFCDIAALLEISPLNVWLECFQKKYPNTDIFTVGKSLAWFEDAEKDPDPVLLRGQTWQSVKKAIVSAMADLDAAF